MGLPDNRDIEPTRDDTFGDFNNQPEFMIHQLGENEQMEIDGDDTDLNNGYLRLQTFENGDEPANDSDSSDGDEEEDENENGPTTYYAHHVNFEFSDEIVEESVEAQPGVPPIVSSDSELEAQVWNTPRTPGDSIELNTEKTEQILKVMSKISLPNIPAWASEVDPGELIQRIRNKQAPAAATSDKI